MRKIIDLAGKRFGRLVAINRSKGKNGAEWGCKCACGNTTIVLQGNLIQGHTKSCGCLQRERISARSTTHGESNKTTEYKKWAGMKTRCLNQNRDSYYRYGGRGISVCDRWKDSYENFLEDMGRCPPGMTIERKDNDEGYNPDNCCWAPFKDQFRNRSSNRHIACNGKTQLLVEWAEEIGTTPQLLWNYLNSGHTMEEAIKYYSMGEPHGRASRVHQHNNDLPGRHAIR